MESYKDHSKNNWIQEKLVQISIVLVFSSMPIIIIWVIIRAIRRVFE